MNDELHVLITVEDSENRAKLKLERAVEEVKKLLTVVSSLLNYGLGGEICPLMANNRESCKLLVSRQKIIFNMFSRFSFCNIH